MKMVSLVVVTSCILFATVALTQQDHVIKTGNFVCHSMVDGMYRDPRDDHVYYYCTKGQAVKFHCLQHRVFNDHTKRCERRRILHNFCSRRANGKYVDPLNRSAYYICHSNQAQVLYCPPGKIFHQCRQECDSPSQHLYQQ